MKIVIVLLIAIAGVQADWDYWSEKDPITDDVTMVISTTSTTGHIEYIPFELLVRVTVEGSRRTTEVFIWGNSNSIGNANIDGIARIDESQPFLVDLYSSSSGEALFFEPEYSEGLLGQLLSGMQFALRFTPPGMDTMTAVFSLQGMTAAARHAGII